MDVYASIDGPCTVCGGPGRACSACYSVFYCGRDHQLQHWQAHKGACAPYKVAKDPVMGRFLLATRDITGGTFTMREKALINGPPMSAEPVCLGCSHRLCEDPEYWHHCTSCGWPLCSQDCQKSADHQPECSAMNKAGFRMGRDCPCIAVWDDMRHNNQWAWYGAIVPIRALLLPEKEYKKLMTLQTHIEEHRRLQEFNMKCRAITNFICNILKLPNFNEEDIATVLAIFDTNAFEVCREDLGLMGRALFYTAALMAHSCQPNARLCYMGEGFEMCLMAEQDIPCGSSINISYMDRLNGTLKRLSHLRATKHFDCTCPRCSDPSDLGLFMDSIRCKKCRDQGKQALLLSTSPLNISANWQCQDETCKFQVSAGEMLHTHKELRAAKIATDELGRLGDYEKFLNHHLGPKGLLHATSSYILQIKVHLIFNIFGHAPGHTLQELTDNQVEYKKSLCQEMMNVANILHPGFTRTRGYVLMEWHSVLMEQVRRLMKEKHKNQQVCKEAVRNGKTMLDEAASILKEPARKAEVDQMMKQFLKKCERWGFSKLG